MRARGLSARALAIERATASGLAAFDFAITMMSAMRATVSPGWCVDSFPGRNGSTSTI